MSISYPLSLPSITNFRGITITKRSVVGYAQSPFTLQQQTQVFPGQQWSADISLPPMNREAAEEWIAFLLKLNGREGSFLLGDPAGVAPRGLGTGAPLVNGASQSGNSLATDGWTINATNILRAGDWFQLGSGNTARLYKNLNDVNSNGSGQATLDIWPSLRSSPANNDPLTINSAQGKFMLASNDQSWSIDVAMIYGISFQAIEDLRT